MFSIIAYLESLLQMAVTRGNIGMVKVDRCDVPGFSQPSFKETLIDDKSGISPIDKVETRATFDQLPLELKEAIFLYLNPRDLTQCSLVCMKWHEIVNSSRVWLKICEVHGISKKIFLKDSYSMMENPHKNFLYIDENLAPSHWRSHFTRYRFVQRNWENGFYVTYSLPLKPIHMSEHCLIEHVGSQLKVHNVHGNVQSFCHIDLAFPDLKIDIIMCKNDYLLYTQNRNVICLKKEAATFKNVASIALDEGHNDITKSNGPRTHLMIRISDKFIVIYDAVNPSVLTFIKTTDSSIRRQINLHKALGSQSVTLHCLEVHGDRVFIAYRISSGSYIAQYDYGKDFWEGPLFVIPSRAVEIQINQKFISAKLHTESREVFNQTSNLYVWMRDSFCLIGDYCANKHVPVILTESDLIYSFRDEIIVRKLTGSYEKSFSVSPSIMNICMVWKNYLVVHDERGVSVWNTLKGKKIVSPHRSDTCITVCASDTNILLRCEDDRFEVVSFW